MLFVHQEIHGAGGQSAAAWAVRRRDAGLGPWLHRRPASSSEGSPPHDRLRISARSALAVPALTASGPLGGGGAATQATGLPQGRGLLLQAARKSVSNRVAPRIAATMPVVIQGPRSGKARGGAQQGLEGFRARWELPVQRQQQGCVPVTIPAAPGSPARSDSSRARPSFSRTVHGWPAIPRCSCQFEARKLQLGGRFGQCRSKGSRSTVFPRHQESCRPRRRP